MQNVVMTSRFSKIARLAAILAILSLALILIHVSHCNNTQDNCPLCLFGHSLVTISTGILLPLIAGSITFLGRNRVPFSFQTLPDRHVCRAPPHIRLSLS